MGIIQRQGIKGTLVTAVGLLIGMVSILWVQPNLLSPEEIGLTRVLYNFSAMVAVFMPLGMANATTRFFPVFRHRESGHHGFLGIILVFAFIGGVICSVFLYLFSDYFIALYSEQSELFSRFFFWVFPLSLTIALIMLLNVYCYSAILRATMPSFFNDVLLRLLLIILFITYSLGKIALQEFVIGYILCYVFQLSLLILYILWMDKVSLRIDWPFLRLHIRYILRFGLFMSFVAFGSLGIKMLDSLILAGYSLKWVGIYSIAAFIPNIIEIPVIALDKIGGSVVSLNISEKNWSELRRIYSLSVHYLFLTGGLIFLLIVINMPFAIQLLPEAYAGGLQVVYIAGIGALCQTLAGTSTAMLFNAESYVKAGISLLILVLINLSLNFLLIPRWGMTGAATAAAISAAAYTIIRWSLTWHEYRMHPFTPSLAKIGLVIAIGLLLNSFIPTVLHPLPNILLRSSIIMLVYGVAVFILRLAPEVIEWLKRYR
jgi:O-antigen/teichoic acid export membrane protein